MRPQSLQRVWPAGQAKGEGVAWILQREGGQGGSRRLSYYDMASEIFVKILRDEDSPL